jgi:RNA-directed DNA polymerase
VRPRLQGEVYYIRYLDEFVLCFQYKSHAIKFKDVLAKCLEKFSLALEPSKTRLIEFGRFADRDAKKRNEKSMTFSFLGFCFYKYTNLHGKYKVATKTEKSRLRCSCIKIKSDSSSQT